MPHVQVDDAWISVLSGQAEGGYGWGQVRLPACSVNVVVGVPWWALPPEAATASRCMCRIANKACPAPLVFATKQATRVPPLHQANYLLGQLGLEPSETYAVLDMGGGSMQVRKRGAWPVWHACADGRAFTAHVVLRSPPFSQYLGAHRTHTPGGTAFCRRRMR